MELDGIRCSTFRFCFPHSHNLENPSTKGRGKIEFHKFSMVYISNPRSTFFVKEFEKVNCTFPKLDFRIYNNFPIWEISNQKSSILWRIWWGNWHLPKGVRHLSTSSAWDPAWSLPESYFIPLGSVFRKNASVAAKNTNSGNGWCFEPQIIVFVKESNKKDHTFPNLDLKISKFKISSFPILDISSQKSLILRRV